jgi:hypothetical protein
MLHLVGGLGMRFRCKCKLGVFLRDLPRRRDSSMAASSGVCLSVITVNISLRVYSVEACIGGILIVFYTSQVLESQANGQIGGWSIGSSHSCGVQLPNFFHPRFKGGEGHSALKTSCDPSLGKRSRTRRIEAYLTRGLLLESRPVSIVDRRALSGQWPRKKSYK